MPGWDLNVTVGGYISYPSLKGGGKKIRDQGNVNAPTPHLRAEHNLHSGCYLHPHMPSFLGKGIRHVCLGKLCEISRRSLGKKQAGAVGEASPRRHLDLTQHMTWRTKPSFRVRRLRTNVTA